MAIITSKTIGNVREMCSFLMFAISNFLSSQAIFTIEAFSEKFQHTNPMVDYVKLYRVPLKLLAIHISLYKHTPKLIPGPKAPVLCKIQKISTLRKI